jgi:3-isopropylmalate/(R)-2-methylmalate dehydratase small subunit
MEKFKTLTAIAAPLMRSNVDTDIIIPMARMVTAERDDMHRHAFEPWRFYDNGSENPDFVLNRDPFRNAEVLITGPNFGCGSSREGAVWALKGLGIRCLIGSGFGNIFYNNCFQNGILPIVLPASVVEQIAANAQTSNNAAVIKIDLENLVVSPAIGEPHPFTVDANRRTQLLEGLDDIGTTLKRVNEIDAFREKDQHLRPWIYG